MALVGCASLGQGPEQGDIPVDRGLVCYAEYSETIFDGNGRAQSFKALSSAAGSVSYVLIGEVHDNPTHHANQLAILKALSKRGGIDHLLLEMLHPGFEDILDAYRRTGATSGTLRAALQWDARGWPVWDAYYPLFEEARRQGATIHGANIADDLVPYVTSFGGLAFPRRKRAQLGLAPDDPFLADREVLTGLVASVHGIPEDASGPLVVAQYAKDAHMARAMAETRGRSVLIAGNYHVQSNIGVPIHLERINPGARMLSVAMVELSETVPSPSAYFGQIPAPLRDYDFVWFTETRCQLDSRAR